MFICQNFLAHSCGKEPRYAKRPRRPREIPGATRPRTVSQHRHPDPVLVGDEAAIELRRAGRAELERGTDVLADGLDETQERHRAHDKPEIHLCLLPDVMSLDLPAEARNGLPYHYSTCALFCQVVPDTHPRRGALIVR